jgi:esterase
MRLFFRHFGQGSPLLILHGLFGQSDNWLTIGKRLAEHFSVFIPDMRNHGQSAHSSSLSYQAMSDDILEFIDENNIVNPIIIGHSMGGKAAMHFTLEHPHLVKKLAVIDISLRKYPERRIHTHIVSTMLSLPLSSFTTRQEVEKALIEKIDNERIRMFILKNLYYKHHGKLAWRLNLDAINNSLDMLFDAVDVPGTFDKEVLFVRGEKSDYIPDEDEGLIKRSFPKAEIKTISGATHWVHADAPDELFGILAEFLS